MPRTAKKDTNLQPGKPLKPANLSEAASREWDRLTGELEAAGIQVTSAHRTVLSEVSKIKADMAEAWEAVEEDGAYSVNAKTGAVQAHPASKRLDALRRDLQKWLVMLGLRAAVAGDTEEKKGKTLEDVLSGE
jgi:P27 family predicted phage terminase small subunit